MKARDPDEIRTALAALSAADREELLSLLKRASAWLPTRGPQLAAALSEADVVGYGGAAGGGKSDLGIGLGLTEHDRTIIYRREAAQLTSIVDRIEELVGTRNGYNSQSNIWRLGNRRAIEFGGFPNAGDEKRFQGRPHDLKVFDEVTEMLEQQVRYLMGWLRSTKRVRQRILMTFNPPTTPEGRWVIKFFAPWLDKRHPLYPTAPGELRWVTTIAGEDHWVPDNRPFIVVGNKPVYDFDRSKVPPEAIVRPMSRTFIPAKVSDNPYLTGDYMAKLQALPEPLRSQMLLGDFEAGMEDDEWQVIPTAWIRASMDRWRRAKALGPSFKPGPMDTIGADAARGGRDKFVLAPRHGRWFDDLIVYPGSAVPLGSIAAGLVVKHRRDRAVVLVDVVGWGADLHGALVDNRVQTVALNGANGTVELSEQGQRFFNMRAQLIWRMREALNPDGKDPIMLPDDSDLELDLASYRWRLTRSGIQIESKEDMKKRLGRSPDRGDAVCYALPDVMKEEVAIDLLEEIGYAGGGGWGDYDRSAI